ncbi:hypothetical protein GCM10011578_006900 [Streptomyces fuscichromogenes]|uniref:Uncharacterized protein n=1 Tax=Streptomyces fuscichromogenes TaxID=1324013 RepID=A0A917UJ84_9ACTN|nr:hypothetical protein GCM10011578_006900 [Streptomyces fuscichromogenes]
MHGEPGFGGQRPAGRCLQRGVTGEPSRDHTGRTGGEYGTDGGGRDFDWAHLSSVGADIGGGQRSAVGPARGAGLRAGARGGPGGFSSGAVRIPAVALRPP